MNIIKDKILYSSIPEKVANNQYSRFVDILFYLIREELKNKGDRDWLVNVQTGQSIKLSEVEGRVVSLSSYLVDIGFKLGDVLQTGCRNHIHFYLPILASWMIGGIASIGNPTLEDDMIKHQLNLTNCNVVVCSKEFMEKYKRISKDNVKLVVLDAYSTDKLPENMVSLQDIINQNNNFVSTEAMLEVQIEDSAVIVCTSGSTGTPKGILHKQKTLINMDLLDCANAEKAQLSTTMYHIAGFSFPIFLGLMQGITVGFIQTFEAEDYMNCMAKFQPEIMIVSCGYYNILSNVKSTHHKFPFLIKLLSIGGVFLPETHARIQELLGKHVMIEEVYASSETYIITHLPGQIEKRQGLCGYLKPNCQLYIADMETGQKLGPNQIGKIMIKAPTMLKSYLKNPRADTEFFYENGFGTLDDFGYYTPEGDIFFSHRNREILRVFDAWFGPAEVENVIERIEQVEEAVVWGEYDPSVGSDILQLAVVFNKAANKTMTKDELREFVKANLDSPKHITGEIYILEDIPHGPLMKKLRKQMKDHVKNF